LISEAKMSMEMDKLKAENAQLKKQIENYKNKEHGLYKYGQGCRCEICKTAKRESMQKYFKKKAIKAKTKGE